MNDKPKILIVDDEPLNLNVLASLLRTDYRPVVAKNGEQALERASTDPPPDLILLDIMMPELNGYEVCRRLKASERTRDIPVIFVTAMGEVEDETRGFDLGAVDYITKPISPPIVAARVKTHLELRAARMALLQQNETLEEKVKERTRELSLTRDATIHSLAGLAETRDPETGGHIRRTQTYVRVLAEYVQDNPRFSGELSPEVIELLYKSAPLHDIGKVGVPDSVLLKPGKLTDEEYEEMKRHTIYGRDALLQAEKALDGTSSFLSYATEIAYTHQEKWDGSGYPQGLRGENIPLSGRLMAIADVYDALISRRCYKPAYTHEEAVRIIREGRGRHFDPELTDAFLEIAEEFRRIADQFRDDADA
ncbi:MAG: two-component system response regulator [Vulcanimicrobiota bacterium]